MAVQIIYSPVFISNRTAITGTQFFGTEPDIQILLPAPTALFSIFISSKIGFEGWTFGTVAATFGNEVAHCGFPNILDLLTFFRIYY